MNGAMNPPEAASTCTGTSGPPEAASASSASAISLTGSYEPSNVEPRMATTPIVFSSTSFSASSALSCNRPSSIGAYRGSTSQ